MFVALLLCLTALPAGFASAAGNAVTVSDTKILKNGREFLIKGMIFQSFVEPLALLQSAGDPSARYISNSIKARDFYFGQGSYAGGKDAFTLLKDWGVNTIRLNLNQSALDPQDPLYSDAYVKEIEAAVAQAEKSGDIVILTPFDGRNKNDPLIGHDPKTALDNATTVRAAQTLAQHFGHDTAVMLETLNEPFWTHSPHGWDLWLNGGIGPKGQVYAGVNAVIKAYRDAGARNVIVAQGINGNFRGFPGGLVDPLNQIAYAAHPFFGPEVTNEADWSARFGDFAASHPFVITAWQAKPSQRWCGPNDIDTPKRFLQYLHDRHIGLVGFAFDSLYSLVNDLEGTPTKWPDQCGKGGGMGELFKQHQ